MSKSRLALRAGLAVAVAATLAATAAHSAAAADSSQPQGLNGDQLAAARRALDPKPPAPTPPVNQVKEAAHRAFMDMQTAFNNAQQARQLGGATPNSTCSPSDPCTRTVTAITQSPQERSYWCGPATLQELVRARQVSISQSTAASDLSTTTDGTDWYNGRYPMADGLNKRLGPYGAVYVPVALPDSPSASDKSNYASALYDDVMHNWGIAGDAYEVTGGPHLVGHPNKLIFHWFAIRGFDGYGAQTRYADSVAGASSISWSGSVPAYSSMSSDTIAVIMGGRGYVW